MFVLHLKIPRLICFTALLALAACQQVPMLPGLTTYRIDIQQGNVVTQEMVDKLKPGMTRQQVRFVLGTPPIVDPFHENRWDYVYYYKKGAAIKEYRRLVLLFDGDALKRIDGDVQPRSAQASSGAVKSEAEVAAPPAEEKGFFGRMLDKIF